MCPRTLPSSLWARCLAVHQHPLHCFCQLQQSLQHTRWLLTSGKAGGRSAWRKRFAGLLGRTLWSSQLPLSLLVTDPCYSEMCDLTIQILPSVPFNDLLHKKCKRNSLQEYLRANANLITRVGTTYSQGAVVPGWGAAPRIAT